MNLGVLQKFITFWSWTFRTFTRGQTCSYDSFSSFLFRVIGVFVYLTRITHISIRNEKHAILVFLLRDMHGSIKDMTLGERWKIQVKIYCPTLVWTSIIVVTYPSCSFYDITQETRFFLARFVFGIAWFVTTACNYSVHYFIPLLAVSVLSHHAIRIGEHDGEDCEF